MIRYDGCDVYERTECSVLWRTNNNHPICALSRHHVLLNKCDGFGFIQYTTPVNERHPLFCVKIISASASSKISVGLADKNLEGIRGAHLGNQHRTLGYHSDSGLVFTSHCSRTQTKAPGYSSGDAVALQILSFNANKCVVIVTKNGVPVCTQYHHIDGGSNLLPSICMERGPVELMVCWPPHIVGTITEYRQDDPREWLAVPTDLFNGCDSTFGFVDDVTKCEAAGDAPGLASIQSLQALSQSNNYYELEVVSRSSKTRRSAGRGRVQPDQAESSTKLLIPCLISGGALPFAPSSPLFCEVLKFSLGLSDVKVGDRIGWSIHYLDTATHLYQVTAQPLLICCFLLNRKCQSAVCCFEPEGGYFPFTVFTSADFRLQLVNSNNTRMPCPLTAEQCQGHLSGFYRLLDHQLLVQSLSHCDIAQGDNEVTVELRNNSYLLRLPAAATAATAAPHTVQCRRMPLSQQHPVFQLTVNRLAGNAAVCVGVAPSTISLSKYPGRSLASLGYHSNDGRILYDGRSLANTQGHTYSQGDQITMELCPMPPSAATALIRIWKNDLPVALRYIDVTSRQQLFPTVSLLFADDMNSSNVTQAEIICELIPPNVITQRPTCSVIDPHYWCLPQDASISHLTNDIHVCTKARRVVNSARCIVSPVPMSRGMHHFEVVMLNNPNAAGVVPPMVGLTTASPYDPPIDSNFKLDLLRFNPQYEDSVVRQGDTVGWGVIFPDSRKSDVEEQLVICYLTVNRSVMLTRGVVQPAGGLLATVILPHGCDRVRLLTDALFIKSHPFTKAIVSHMYKEAQFMAESEATARLRGDELPCELSTPAMFYKSLAASTTDHGDGASLHNLADPLDCAVHSIDPLVDSRSKSKSCAIL